MTKAITGALVFLVPLLLLQTTWLSSLALWGVTANWVLVLLIFSTQNGSLFGMVCGFLFGLLVDFLLMLPLGLSSFVFTFVGYLFGLGKGKFFFDPVVVPFLAGVLGSLVDSTLQWILRFAFQLAPSGFNLFSVTTLIQWAMNGTATVMIFAIVSFVRRNERNRRGFHV